VFGSAFESKRLVSEAAVGLLGELESRAIAVASIDDILLDEDNAEKLAPLLLAHIFSARYPPFVQVLVDKVAVPQAADYAIPQLAFFIRRVPGNYHDPIEAELGREAVPTWHERIRDYIGSALGQLVTPGWSDVFLELASDRDLGSSRFEIIHNLSKLHDERVPAVLLTLLDDPSVRVLAAEALGEMRCPQAKSALAMLALTGGWDAKRAATSALRKIMVSRPRGTSSRV